MTYMVSIDKRQIDTANHFVIFMSEASILRKLIINLKESNGERRARNKLNTAVNRMQELFF